MINIILLNFILLQFNNYEFYNDYKFIFHNEIKRSYIIYLPKGFDNSKKYPLLIVMHGGFGDGKSAIRLTLGKFNN